MVPWPKWLALSITTSSCRHIVSYASLGPNSCSIHMLSDTATSILCLIAKMYWSSQLNFKLIPCSITKWHFKVETSFLSTQLKAVSKMSYNMACHWNQSITNDFLIKCRRYRIQYCIWRSHVYIWNECRLYVKLHHICVLFSCHIQLQLVGWKVIDTN